MKNVMVVLLSIVFHSVASAQDMRGMNMNKKDTSHRTPAATYTCVMHPQIHSARPGNCPICSMRLVKEKQKAVKSQPAAPTQHDMPIPMKDSINMDKMAGMQTKDSLHTAPAMGNMPMKDMAAPVALPMKTIINHTPPRTVRYDLYIKDTTINYSGKSKRAIAVNGQIPMPTLIFTEGDTAEIYVHNELNEETALHWHGLFLPNRYDGVPNLTQMPIMPHTTHLYRFPIIQHGTHLYHSHSMFQQQIGMYGLFIMNKREDWDIPTLPVIVSEWADMKPEEINRSLHNATDWFGIKKGSTQSYGDAIKTGHFKTKLINEWKRMTAMDVSDVYYDQFLINGKNQIAEPPFKGGSKVRLRIANGGSSDYFWLTYSGGKITVVASDGNDVTPVEVDRLIIGVAETYDVIVTIPESKSYEFLVTPEDRTKSASLWLGAGEKVPAARLPKLKYFAGMEMMNGMMDMRGNMVEMQGMSMKDQEMDMNAVMYPEITGPEKPADTAKKGIKPAMKMDNSAPKNSKPMQMNQGSPSMAGMDMGNKNSEILTLNYGMLRAVEKTTLRAGGLKILQFDLTGNMNRYVWTMNNKTVSESDRIQIKKGENVRIILFNNTMMRHPMHLHGHDFRVLNGQDDYAPLKNTIDIMPTERDTIEFTPTETDGDWFFHCHILYHMMSGMGRIFHYENTAPNPEIPEPKKAQRMLFADDRMPHFMAKVGLESSGSDGEAMLAQTRWQARTMWNLGLSNKTGFENETMIGRYLGRMQWWFPYIGFDYHYKIAGGPKNIFGSENKNWFGQKSDKLNRHTVMAGIAYTLPLLFIADARIDGNGKLLFQLGREDVPLTSRLRFNLMVNTDKEYMAGLRYIVTKYFSLSTHYDSDMGLGAGVTITY